MTDSLPPEPNASGRDRQPTIVIAEDEPDNRIILQTVMESLFGAHVLSVSIGTEVVPLVTSTRPALVLLDLMLPLQDGFSIARELKRNPATASIPIIAVSALARVGDREEALAAGCDDFIRKPFELDQLEATVTKYVAAR